MINRKMTDRQRGLREKGKNLMRYSRIEIEY